MSAVWITVGGLAVATALIKAAGPVLLGGRELPPRAASFIALLPAALLAALVVAETFTAIAPMSSRTMRSPTRRAGSRSTRAPPASSPRASASPCAPPSS